ncbi:MAG: DUF2201 family putative metallopeptidase [Pseudonocardiaceae bacterium]
MGRAAAAAITPSALNLPESWLAEQYYDALTGRDPQPRCAADCGSGADGVARPWDCDRPGLSAVERRLLGLDIARRIAEHVASRGDIPAGWQRWAQEVLEPVVDWRRVLRSAVRRGIADVAGRVDFSYRRPSRRSSSSPGVVLPSLRQPRPVVAVVIDTSGSMSDGMLEQTLGEVAGLLNGLGIGRTHRAHRRPHAVAVRAAAAIPGRRRTDGSDRIDTELGHDRPHRGGRRVREFDDPPQDLTAWLRAGLRRVEAVQWRRWRFNLEEAQAWRAAGVSVALTAAQWCTAAVTPGTVDQWRAAGIGPGEAVRWHEFGVDLPRAVQIKAATSPDPGRAGPGMGIAGAASRRGGRAGQGRAGACGHHRRVVASRYPLRRGRRRDRGRADRHRGRRAAGGWGHRRAGSRATSLAQPQHLVLGTL